VDDNFAERPRPRQRKKETEKRKNGDRSSLLLLPILIAPNFDCINRVASGSHAPIDRASPIAPWREYHYVDAAVLTNYQAAPAADVPALFLHYASISHAPPSRPTYRAICGTSQILTRGFLANERAIDFIAARIPLHPAGPDSMQRA